MTAKTSLSHYEKGSCTIGALNPEVLRLEELQHLSNTHLNSMRKSSIVVGVLFIISTVAGALNVALLQPILGAQDYLTAVAANENQIVISVLLDLICAGAFVAISVAIYPILKLQYNRLAIGYIAARILEAVPFVIGVTAILTLLTLSQEYVDADLPGTMYYQTLGDLLVAVKEWTLLLGPMLFFSLTALILNYVLYQTNLVPKVLSIWGLAGTLLMLAAALFGLFGLDPQSTISIALILPIALNEMALALWLIVKGFNPSVISIGTANPA